MRLTKVSLASALLLVSFSCNQSPRHGSVDDAPRIDPVANHKNGPSQPEARNQGADNTRQEQNTGENLPADERMVIRNATLELRSESLRDLAQEATKIAEGAKGYVVSSDTYGSGEALSQVSITVRIPAASFEETLSQLRSLGEPLRESVTGQDVTAEYFDLQAQLNAQRAVEKTFLELLGRAQSIEDTLKVEAELSRVRMEIDRLEGRSRYLKNQSALSTIHVTALASYQPYETSAESVSSRFLRALQQSGEVLVEILIGFVIALGAILPFGLLALPFGLWWRASRRAKRAASQKKSE